MPLRGNDRPGSPQGCPVASRHSARESGVWGANLQNVPLDHVPLAGSTPLKGRQAEFYKYQSGRRSTANSEASPIQHPRRTALSSPAEVAAQGRPRERSPEPLVLARFCLLLARAKSRRRVRGREAPGLSIRKQYRRPRRGRKEPRRQIKQKLRYPRLLLKEKESIMRKQLPPKEGLLT